MQLLTNMVDLISRHSNTFYYYLNSVDPSEKEKIKFELGQDEIQIQLLSKKIDQLSRFLMSSELWEQAKQKYASLCANWPGRAGSSPDNLIR